MLGPRPLFKKKINDCKEFWAREVDTVVYQNSKKYFVMVRERINTVNAHSKIFT